MKNKFFYSLLFFHDSFFTFNSKIIYIVRRKSILNMWALLFIFSFSYITGSAQNPNPSPLVDNEILSIMNSQKLPGASTVIVKGGEIVWIESYGFANTDLQTAFMDTTSLMLASVSKVFTGVAILQLSDAGLIALDDNINEYLPFDISIPNHASTPITFQMLLTHTSSIADNWNAMDGYYNDNGDPTIPLEECMQRYFSSAGQDYSATANFINDQPGTVYEYSNMATALSGYLVELISEMPFNEYCNQNIFDPLCMNNTRWFLSEFSNLNAVANPHDYFAAQYEPIEHFGFADYPNGMLHSNSKDLANFMIALLQNGAFNNIELLYPATVSEIFTPQIPAIEPTQGLQFYLETFFSGSGSISLWGHSGAEYGIDTHLYFDRENDLGIAVLTNGNDDSTEILEVLYDYGLTLSTSGVGNPACDFTSNVQETNDVTNVSVYPNPANKAVTFEVDILKNDKYEIIISDLTGQQIMSTYIFDNKKNISTSNLPVGMYLYVVKLNNSIIKTGKLIVNH